jgi:hypothetical protein
LKLLVIQKRATFLGRKDEVEPNLGEGLWHVKAPFHQTVGPLALRDLFCFVSQAFSLGYANGWAFGPKTIMTRNFKTHASGCDVPNRFSTDA